MGNWGAGCSQSSNVTEYRFLENILFAGSMNIYMYMYVYSFCSYNSHSRGQFRAPPCAYAY